MIIKPARLEKGQTIGIVGPASPMIQERLTKGIEYVKQKGYKVKTGKHVNKVYGYLAGNDSERAEDINEMFSDPDVHAVFCTRGGYGTPRIIEKINYDLIKSNPKIFVGFSDITALQLALFAKTEIVTFSGPMVAVEMAKGIDKFTESNFWRMLTRPERRDFSDGIESFECLKEGCSEGRFLGGCLALICSLVGSKYLPDFNDAILFIEDVGEEPYQIDRRLMQLKLSGVLSKINGMVLGQLDDCFTDKPEPSLSLEQIIEDITADLDIPILAGLPYGHVDVKHTIPIGARVRLDASNKKLTMIEAVVK